MWYEISQDARDSIHDLLIEDDHEPSVEAINLIVKRLPDEIIKDAEIWGWSDTVVRENILEFIRAQSDIE